MLLKTLKLQYFKNYQGLDVKFGGGINCILGKNGMGKTNLIDAIHYLSMTRSALNSNDSQSIMMGGNYFSINGVFEDIPKASKVNIYFESGKKKLVKVDGAEPERLSDHIGQIPSIISTPDDTEIIKEGSETRRKLFDSVISQFNNDYLLDLMQLQRILKQRNSFLKQNEGRRNVNRTFLSVYDEKILPINHRISQVRKDFTEVFESFLERNYLQIFSGNEQPKIQYVSDCLEEDFVETYHKALEKDVLLQRTTIGCHKDDYTFKLSDQPIKKFGSQGQQKSFIIALKLAEYDFLKEKKGVQPLVDVG